MVCVWPLDPSSCCPDWDDYDPGTRASAWITASQILWSLSGRRFVGVPLADEYDGLYTPTAGWDDTGCTTTLRPCRQHTGIACDTCGWPGMGAGIGWYGGPAFIPYLAGGQWYNATCGTCGTTCDCDGTLDRLELPGPVAAVGAVYIDGEIFTDWSLYNSETLIRTDGEPWPRCQNLAADLTEAGTWAVEYVRGIPVPVGGRRAAAILACELAKACTGQKCRIPANVTEVTRNGVSFTFDPTVYYTSGLTGIPEVDLWLSATNPGRNRRSSAVYTPHTLTRDNVRRQPGEVTP